MIITQFHNLTNTVNRPTKIITDLDNNQMVTAIMVYGSNAFELAVTVGECSPIEIVNNIMKLCDYYAAKKSKFIAYS